jgi:hypothetical protein
MRAALSRSGIDITPATVNDLVRFLASNGSGGSAPGGQPGGKGEGGRGGRAGGRVVGAGTGGPHSAEEMYITFSEFRDFLIMLPRKATPFEIYKCKRNSSSLASVDLICLAFPTPLFPYSYLCFSLRSASRLLSPLVTDTPD